jgi:hypothetical protein
MDTYYKRSFRCPNCKHKWHLASRELYFKEAGRTIDMNQKNIICPKCWINKIKGED